MNNREVAIKLVESDYKDPPIARIIQGPHLLFTGANGRKTYGIKVKALDPEAVHRGFSDEWLVNDYDIQNPKWKDKLGLSDEEYKKLIDEINELVRKQ